MLALLTLCAAAAHAAPDVHPACSPAPADCSGWYRVHVTISWTLDPGLTKVTGSCGSLAITTDGTTISTCKATVDANPGASVQREQPVKVDQTPPTLLPPAPARPADANGWYRLPVDVAFAGSDAMSGIAGCTGARYTGLDAAAVTVAGTCADAAGNTATGTFPLRFDATPPVIKRAIAGRGPDHEGWYNHPVVMRFRAKDALSGLAQCPPVLVSGSPSSRARAFNATCADVAGNVATKAFTIHYDATPPATPVLRVTAADRRARIAITASRDTETIRIARVPGLRGHRSSRVYQGRVRSFTDRRVSNGRRYRYTVTAIDRAGNTRRKAARVRVGARLLGPPDGSVVSAPPLLSWTPVRDARYLQRPALPRRGQGAQPLARGAAVAARAALALRRPGPAAPARPLPLVRLAGSRATARTPVRHARRRASVHGARGTGRLRRSAQDQAGDQATQRGTEHPALRRGR